MENVYQKIKKTNELIKTTNPDVKEEEIFSLIDHICRYLDGSRKTLSDKELALKVTLDRQGLNAYTVKLWYSALLLPKHFQIMIKEGNLTYRQAIINNKDFKLKTDVKIEAEIRQDILEFIKRLKDKEFISKEFDRRVEDGSRNII